MTNLELIKILSAIKAKVNTKVNMILLWDACQDMIYPDYRVYVEAQREGLEPDKDIDELYEAILDLIGYRED